MIKAYRNDKVIRFLYSVIRTSTITTTLGDLSLLSGISLAFTSITEIFFPNFPDLVIDDRNVVCYRL